MSRTAIQYLGFVLFCCIILLIQYKKEMDNFENTSKMYQQGVIEGMEMVRDSIKIQDSLVEIK